MIGGSDVVLVDSTLTPVVKDVGELPTEKRGKSYTGETKHCNYVTGGCSPELRRFSNMHTNNGRRYLQYLVLHQYME